MIGKTISHYKILEKLGGGGMGVVYKAEDTRLERTVALKFLPPHLGSEEEQKERFIQEAKAASALDHTNICTIHEIDETAGGQLFIAMAYYDGETLKKKIGGGRLKLKDALDFAQQIAGGLAKAHSQGIVHRDIKPANVMITQEGVVKILDFGLAKLVGQTGITDSGTTLGTVAYMSPEQTRGEGIDQRSDIWSLGVVLYEMISGQQPFKGEYAEAIIYSILHEDPQPISALRRGLPEELTQVVDKALTKSPWERYQGIEELLAELRTLRGEKPAVPSILPLERHTVGREKERAELQEGLQAAAAGQGLLMCVAGEPGIGKTTLIEEFLDELTYTGSPCTIARGRCSERLSGTEAYLPFLEVLESLLKNQTDGSVTEMMRELAPWWYAQSASLSADDPADAGILEEVRNATQERVKRELARFLEELSRRRPLLFFFDDLHWSDVSTIDLLTYLGGKFESMRLLIVTAYRPTEMRQANHPFLQIKPDLQSHGVCREIELGFLSREEIGHYLTLEYSEHGFPGDFPRFIHDRTEGSPLFMAELVRYLHDQGVIVEEKGLYKLTQSVADIRLELPESVQGMIRRKIDRLSEEERRLLTAASVQGYEFDTAVLARVLVLDVEEVEERLQALERDHRLVRFIEEGEFPDRTLTLHYRFVHVLYQNELYASLTRTRQGRLSKAVAEALLGYYPGEQRGAVASELAVLFEMARDFERAVQYFGLAAQNALQVFAYREAIVLARRGLEVLKKLPDTPERTQQELQIQIALGLALMANKGYASPEVEQNNARKQELIRKLGETPQLFPALWGLFAFNYIRGKLKTALDWSKQLLELAQREEDSTLLLLAHHAMGCSRVFRGEFVSSRVHLEEALKLYEPQQHGPLAYLYGSGDIKVNILGHYSWGMWCHGYPDQARGGLREALALSRKLSQPFTTAHVLMFASILHLYRRETWEVQEYAEEGIAICTEHGFPHWLAVEMMTYGWSFAEEGRVDEGIVQMHQGLTAWRATGAGIWDSCILTLLAEAHGKVGQTEQGFTLLAEALTLVNGNAERFWEAEVHRLKGELLLRQKEKGRNESEAEACFQQALEVARRQEGKSLELRAAVSLSRLRQKQGRQKEARETLSGIYNWFTEGFDTVDLKEARALMEELE